MKTFTKANLMRFFFFLFLVGAGSVVTKDVPPNTVVAGVPAKVMKKLEEVVVG